MHTCKTCGSCMNLDMNLAYLTDPPQYKCKESGRLHFQSDICDMKQEDNIVSKHLTEEQIKKSLAFLAGCILELDRKYASIHIYPQRFDVDAIGNLNYIKRGDCEYVEDVKEWGWDDNDI